MFSISGLPSTATQMFSAYASFAGTIMLVRSMADQLIPNELRSYLYSAISYLFTPLSSQLTLIIDELSGFIRNQVYEAAEIYLRTKVKPTAERLRVTKTPRQKNLTVAIERGEEIVDSFDGVQLKWTFVCAEPRNEHSSEKRHFELSFNKKFKDKVFDSYLPFILIRSKEIKDEDKVVKLYTSDGGYCDDDGSGGGLWGSINLEHPATFETLAMDPELKKTIIEDLQRFVRRREFYKKVGKAWKRGYLLYGPPGTGKSSLIAAMANYLKFDVFDLELSSIYSNSDLRRILVSTSNRSILVIEDIDCNPEAHDRENGDVIEPSTSKLTLSGLLNFIDGLWSSCGDERIIVFTTNHKDRLDPALLRPGRMDVHIHMSYCNPHGFRILASNYLDIHGNHHLCGEIEDLIENTEVTPAEVAEELMKSEDPDTALGGLFKFLKRKKIEGDESKEEGADIELKDAKRIKINDKKKKVVRNNFKTDTKKKTVTRNVGRRVVRGGRSRR